MNSNDSSTQLSSEELLRYARHFVLPEMGMEGQKKLKFSSALVVGVGGLGSIASTYLAAAGIGRLGLVDFDEVDHSNLHRQPLYGTSDVGKSKVAIAQKKITEINPNVSIIQHHVRLDSQNALDILSSYDVILDCSDNLPARYLVNDACVILGKPNVYGAVFQFEGQSSVFCTKDGPCYRCLFPEPPSPELVQSCAESGVLGMVPATIGSIQSIEAVKLIVGIGKSLAGRLILFDASMMDFREVKIEKVASCPVCGKNPTIHGLIDYQEFCGMKKEQDQEKLGSLDVSVQELKARLDKGEKPFLLDVREPFEYDIAHLDAKLIPLQTLPNRLSELDREREIIVYCHTGIRSASAAEYLRSNGFKLAKNLSGGIAEWSRKIDPTMPRY
jgi:molybdopterin/thiamine biosynthesis adenylyltransferase/rhodanese-related sulfurtransferase